MLTLSPLKALEIADVPLLLRPPIERDRQTPLILLWHGFGSPNCEADIAEVFPLQQVNAWKAYLGLPLFGKRSIGHEASMHRLTEDYVLKLLLPVMEQAAAELPKVVERLRSHCHLEDNAPLGLFGFSVGSLTTLLTLVENPLPIQAAAVVGGTKDLSSVVDGYERFVQTSYEALKQQYPNLKLTYEWSEESEAAKPRLDFVAHSNRIAQRKPAPAILLTHGVQDEVFDISDVETLYTALKTEYQAINHSEKVSLKIFQHLKHAIDLTSNPSSEQSADLVEMESAIADWFNQFL